MFIIFFSEISNFININNFFSTSENMASYSSTLNNSTYIKSTVSQISSRRSKKALNKVNMMKKTYTMARSETITTEEILNRSEQLNESFKIPDDLNDEFENEVKNLYTWTQNLSINDDYLNSPRLPL